MKSVMQHTFSQVPRADIPRSKFDRSHGIKTTFDAGYLIPIFLDEALPGDTFNASFTAFSRLATPIHPIMDNAYMDTHFFSVPIRLLWDNWEKFCGERKNPNDSVDYTVPVMSSGANGDYPIGSMSDYFGIPTGVVDMRHSVLWHRAYNLIYNEWFRDQNLQDSAFIYTGDNPGDGSLPEAHDETPDKYPLRRRGKRHDYFTSCLPWPQKGDPVFLPLGNRADIRITPFSSNSDPNKAMDDHFVALRNLQSERHFGYDPQLQTHTNSAVMSNGDKWNLYADLSNATAATINQLREAFQVQKLLERDARGGTRYYEVVKSHFGVDSPDLRTQRPEYLGGGSTPINVTPVPQTSQTTTGSDPSPQGNLGAFGTASLNKHGFTKSFTEHCVLLGFVSVRADLTYQQGLNRMFSRRTRYDYYWPVLSHIGEQAVLNKEIYAQGHASEDDEKAFGYQERYAEYRYNPSRISGQFRSSHPQSLDVWHLSQDFGALPGLNPDFIEENPPFDRVVAVPGTPEHPAPHFILDGYMKMMCARPMPLYGVPGLIDHF